ncbi:MAG: DUF4493 domain-containing protein [Bacteroidaceae bacterium]|nr:DUF4493 domain-containing protein [Bacteroidaceae bacterium]
MTHFRYSMTALAGKCAALPAILAATLLLAACNASEPQPSVGTLLVSDITLGSVPQVTVASRAVATDLNIQIIGSKGEVVKSFAAGDKALDEKIILPLGEYTLSAFTSNVKTAYKDNELGAAKFSATKPFMIAEDRVTYLSLDVPMVNAAVRLTLPPTFTDWFTTYTFTATIGPRTISIKDGETAYYDLPVSATPPTATYTLTATNTDGEALSSSGSFQVTPGTLYAITYNMGAKKIVVSHQD